MHIKQELHTLYCSWYFVREGVPSFIFNTILAEGFMSVYIPCATQKPQVPAGAHSSRSRQVEAECLINEELNETASTSSGATDTDIDKEMESRLFKVDV
ncbi:hypothetical protein DCAR_0518522 [Daucus carota subsp. sativus]|uniref:Uncharacterized protein n=1 Tax=Daucus carota subsp. sativus TaxID=79200 RepID=A0A164XAT2_DAUCS|nr:hypothetical protein DCAR_0518522 [Daucus carota subsp. sativus]